MSDDNEGIKNIHKRLQSLEEAIRDLYGQDLRIVRIMAMESCDTQYHVYLLFQRGEEIDKYIALWQKRLEDTCQAITDSQTIEQVAEVRDKFSQDIINYVKATKVDSADKAMEIAHSFIKKYTPVALPLKAIRQDDIWLVDIDVGAFAVKVAKVKVDARTGDILSYEIPAEQK